MTLLAGAGLLLLIACVNVASLMLVRAESRRRETAVRGALGATPQRLVRQFVTEGLLLASLGCGAGVLLAIAWMSLLARLVPKAIMQGMPFLAVVGLNQHTAFFAAGATLMAAVLLAATPVLRLAFREIREGLSEGGRGAASRFWRRLGANLVVVELTVAVVLLACAGLLAKSFYRLLHVETGFDTSHLATVYVMAPDGVYAQTRTTNRPLSPDPGEGFRRCQECSPRVLPAIFRCSAIATLIGFEFPAGRSTASTMKCCNAT